MRRQSNILLMKEQDKAPEEEELREVEIISLLKKDFKVTNMKMLNKLERRWINTVRVLTKSWKIQRNK